MATARAIAAQTPGPSTPVDLPAALAEFAATPETVGELREQLCNRDAELTLLRSQYDQYKTTVRPLNLPMPGLSKFVATASDSSLQNVMKLCC